MAFLTLEDAREITSGFKGDWALYAGGLVAILTNHDDDAFFLKLSFPYDEHDRGNYTWDTDALKKHFDLSSFHDEPDR